MSHQFLYDESCSLWSWIAFLSSILASASTMRVDGVEAFINFFALWLCSWTASLMSSTSFLLDFQEFALFIRSVFARGRFVYFWVWSTFFRSRFVFALFASFYLSRFFWDGPIKIFPDVFEALPFFSWLSPISMTPCSPSPFIPSCLPYFSTFQLESNLSVWPNFFLWPLNRLFFWKVSDSFQDSSWFSLLLPPFLSNVLLSIFK